MIFVDFFRKDKKLLGKKTKFKLIVMSLNSSPKLIINNPNTHYIWIQCIKGTSKCILYSIYYIAIQYKMNVSSRCQQPTQFSINKINWTCPKLPIRSCWLQASKEITKDPTLNRNSKVTPQNKRHHFTTIINSLSFKDDTPKRRLNQKG